MTQQQGFSAVVCSVVMPPGKMSENKPGMKEKKKEKTKPLEEVEGEKKRKKKKHTKKKKKDATHKDVGKKWESLEERRLQLTHYTVYSQQYPFYQQGDPRTRGTQRL